MEKPSDVAGAAVATVFTPVAAGSLVAKAKPGNLYGFNVTTGGSAGYLMLFDDVTVPAEGAVTPKRVISIAANTTLDRSFTNPLRFNKGIVLVFSTTGPFTKTISATAFLAADLY